VRNYREQQHQQFLQQQQQQYQQQQQQRLASIQAQQAPPPPPPPDYRSQLKAAKQAKEVSAVFSLASPARTRHLCLCSRARFCRRKKMTAAAACSSAKWTFA
jgi:hypothetical protein